MSFSARNKTEYYTEDELRKIQSIERTALKILIDVCEKINVEYFLIGGTALGAVRHKGFIPWDDDIDIGMTRENYIRFLEEAPPHFPPGYSLQTPYNEYKNPYYFTKLRVDGTKFVEYCNHKLKINHGVYIDIFPFDEVPDDDVLNEKEFTEIRRLIHLLVFRQSPGTWRPPEGIYRKVKAVIKWGLYCVLHVVPYRFLVNLIDRKITRHNESGQSALACLNFPIRKTEYIKKEDLYPLAELEFEGIKAKLPRNYEVYLTTHYGNFMQLPPEEERVGHKPYLVDLGEWA